MNDEIEMREKNRKAMSQGMTVMNGRFSLHRRSERTLTGRYNSRA
jgi:hypothetical protein